MASSRGPVATLPAWQVWLVAAAVTVGIAVAAASERVVVWTSPEPGATEQVGPADRTEPVAAPEATESVEQPQPGWIGTALQVLSIGVFAAAVLLGLFASTQFRGTVRAWRRSRLRSVGFSDPLPDSAEGELRIDAGAARASLSEGPPRNAIVACWIRLETDVAAAGIPRHVAETSSEYVERVIGRSSVDGAPITELAALYREARFSTHDLHHGDRERAARALDRVVSALGDEEAST